MWCMLILQLQWEFVEQMNITLVEIDHGAQMSICSVLDHTSDTCNIYVSLYITIYGHFKC